MNKILLAVLLLALATGLGAVYWTLARDVAPEAAEAGAGGARVERSSAGPTSSPADPLAVLAAPTERETEGQREAARAGVPARELRVRVAMPLGVPSDERVRVTASFPNAGEAKTTAEVGPEGLAVVEVPAGVQAVELGLEALYLYLEGNVYVAAPFEESTLAPQLGARFSVALTLPPAIPADVGLDAAPPFEASLRGFDMRGGSHSTDKPVADRRTVEFGGLRPGYSYFLSVDPHVLAPVSDLDLSFEAGQHVERSYEITLGATVRGVVRGPDGAPLPGARARIDSRRNWMGGEGRSQTTDEQGAFVLRGVSPGKIRVEATREGFLRARSDELELLDGQSGDVALQLELGNRVAGRVSWPDGTPAARVQVRCAQADAARFGAESERGETDAEGRFEFSGLQARSFDVRAWSRRDAGEGEADAKSEATAEWSASATKVEAGAELALVLEPPRAVRGRVVAGDKPLESYSISHRWSDGGGGRARTIEFTDAAAGFELWLGVGEHTLNASAPEHSSDELSRDVRVQVPQSGAELVLRMRRDASVTGVVLSPSGAPVARASVEARRTTGRGFGRGRESVRADENGRFALPGLPPGVSKLVASADGFAPSVEYELDVVEGQSVEDVRLALRVGGAIEGVIYDSKGAPDPGRRIMVGSFGPNMGEMAGQATSDQGGRFLIEHVAPGTHNVIATPRMNSMQRDADPAALMASLKMTSVEVLDGQTAHIVLGAPPAAPVRLWGRVTRGDEPMGEGMVTAIADGGSLLDSMKFARIGQNGEYEITLDKPGAYTLLVGRSMGAGSAGEFFEVIPETPEHRLDLALPSGAIRGRVVDADGAPLARVAVRHELEGKSSLSMFDMNRQTQTDESGRFEIRDLPAGSYTLRAGGSAFPGSGAESRWSLALRTGVVVGEDRLVEGIELRLERPGTIEGVVLDEQSRPAPEASIFVRDERGVLLNPFSSTRTDGQGRFRYESAGPGAYTVSARSTSSASSESALVRVDSGAKAEVQLRLAGGTQLVVEIEASDGRAVQCDVRVLDERGHDHAALMSFDGLQSLMNGGVSSMERRFGPLAPGRYRVEVVARGAEPVSKPVTLSGQSERTVKIRLRGD